MTTLGEPPAMSLLRFEPQEPRRERQAGDGDSTALLRFEPLEGVPPEGVLQEGVPPEGRPQESCAARRAGCPAACLLRFGSHQQKRKDTDPREQGPPNDPNAESDAAAGEAPA